MADYKLNIFDALRALDRQDGDWLANQTEDARKAFVPSVFMRWASSVKGDGEAAEYALVMLNERLNRNFWEIAKHPELAFRLGASCGTKLGLSYQWIPNAGGRKASNKAREFIASFYPSANEQEIDLVMSKFTNESFKEFANESGIPADDIKNVVKAFDKLSGSKSDDDEKAKKSRKK